MDKIKVSFRSKIRYNPVGLSNKENFGAEMEEKTLEALYGLKQNPVELKRVRTLSGRYLDLFKSPGRVLVKFPFPEFTCLCPKTSQPDFAEITLIYVPDKWCVELKSLKYYFNSFRNDGQFHEQVMVLMEKDLRQALVPTKLFLRGKFNRRGGIEPEVEVGDLEI